MASPTPDGFLWIGTPKGLARFDGLHFDSFKPGDNPGLEVKPIADMAVDSDAHLYMATIGGMTILDERKANIAVAPTQGKTDVVQVVLPVGRHEAWFGTLNGYLYHYHDGATDKIDPARLSGDSVYGLAQTRDGTLWIATGNGLLLLSHGQVVRYVPKIALPIKGFYDLALSDTGSIYAATDRGVLKIQGEDWRFWTTKDGLPSDRIQVLAAAPGDVLWVGTSSGLARIAEGHAHSISTPPCSVGALSADSADSVWVGCEHNGGLLHLKKQVVELESLSAKIPIVRVSSMVVDRSGINWMATLNGLLRWQDNRSRLYTTKDGLPNNDIFLVSLAPDGSLWIGTESGFARMHDGKIESFHTQTPGSEDPVISILEDRAGTLWVGTMTALLIRPRGQTGLETTPKIAAQISSIREDREGRIWVSTAGKGLHEFSGSSHTQFGTACGLASDRVRDTLEDSNGDIWIATASGLSRLRNGNCASAHLGNGLQLGDITAFASDLEGHLWLRVQDGAIAVSISEVDRAIDHAGTVNRTWFYGGEDGFGDQLVSVSQMNSVVRRASGKMWFGTAGGVGSIDPSVLAIIAPPLQPQVTAFASDLGEHDLLQPISVKPGDLRVQLTYTAPTMNDAQDLDFRYQLVGFDKLWRTGGKQRDAVYTSLPPGRYRFRISARRPFEPWSDSRSPIEIRIQPHYYQTWWWYLLLAFTLVTVILVAYQLRLREIRRQFAILMSERLHERSRLARELHDTLAQGMVGIHFQIEAAQVLLDVDPSSVRKHLENVSRLAREASIETRKSIAELRSDESQDPNLSAVLMEVASGFSGSCTVALIKDISADLPRFSPEIVHEITRFLEEALANVRVHSLADHVYLNAYSAGKSFVLKIVDDGKGFLLDDLKPQPGHFGIKGMNERAKRISGRVTIKSELGKGTNVTLEVPLGVQRSRSLASFYLSRRSGL